MIDNDYRIKGIVHYPQTTERTEVLNDVYDLRQKIEFNQQSGTIQKNSIVTGKTTGASAIVTEIENENLYLSEVVGKFQIGETLVTSSGTGFIENIILPKVDLQSGRISLLNFHEPYDRLENQIDELRYVIRF